MFLKNLAKDLISILRPRGKGISVLMYHSIDDNDVFFTVRPEVFKRQMEYLKDNDYTVIEIPELIKLLEGGKELPKKTVTITFDDGYMDIYTNAFSILKKYNFPATVFLPTNFIDKDLTNKQGINLKLLNWDQINEMEKSGLIDFQPHGLNHVVLNKISLEEAENDIERSKRLLETRLDKVCQFFSYPKGRYNQGIIELLKKNNFKAGFAIKPGLVKKGDNLFSLKRQSINSNVTFTQFKSKL